MIKKMVKYSLSVLVLVVIVLLAIPFFLDVDHYKQQIEQEVEDATGRALQIGEMHASLFPWVGVTLDQVTLANREGFTAHDFLKVKHLDVQVAFLPLLSKAIEIKRFKLDEPEIYLERNAKGEGNWEDLLPASSKEAAPAKGKTTAKPAPSSSPSTSPALAALTAESLKLKDGKFTWKDDKAGKNIVLSDVQVLLDDVQLKHPVSARISARVNGDLIEMQANIGPLLDVSHLDVEHLPVQLIVKSDAIALKSFASSLPALPEMLGDIHQASLMLNVQAEQRPDGVRLLAGDAALTAASKVALSWKVEMPNANALHIKNMAVSINDKALLHMQGDVKDLSKTPNYQIRVQSEKIQRAWLSDFVPALTQMYAAHPAPWDSVKLGASLAGSTQRLDIRDMQLLLNDEMLQLSGTANFSKAPDIRLRVAANTLHIDPWLPQPKEDNSKQAGEKPASASDAAKVPSKDTQNAASKDAPSPDASSPDATPAAVEPDLRFLKPWRVSLQLQIEQLLMRGLAMEHLRGSLNGERGIFKLDPLRFDLAGGQVREVASLNVNRYPASWTESIHISGLTLKPVLKALADTDLLDGTMQLDTHIQATGLLPKASLASLNGTGQLLLQNGRVKGFDIAGALRNLSSLGTSNSGSQYTDFAQLQASFKIRNGIAKNDDLFMASPLFRLTGKGIVDLPASTLDYHVRPKLIGSLVGQGDTLTVRKGLSVPLHIFGALASPKVRPELDAKSVIENIGGVLGSGGGAVGGVLGKVLGAGGKTKKATPKQKAAPTTPKQKAQKALQGILGF